MNNTRFVRSLSLLLLAAVCLSAAGCRGLAEYLKGIVEISDAGTDGPLETEGILQTEPVTDAFTQPPETQPAYVYAPDPDETFADDASRTAAKLADAAIGEGYRALCAYPDDPHVVVMEYDPALHPAAYSTLSDSRKAIYDTVYNAVSVFGSFSYN